MYSSPLLEKRMQQQPLHGLMRISGGSKVDMRQCRPRTVVVVLRCQLML